MNNDTPTGGVSPLDWLVLNGHPLPKSDELPQLREVWMEIGLSFQEMEHLQRLIKTKIELIDDQIFLEAMLGGPAISNEESPDFPALLRQQELLNGALMLMQLLG